MGLDFGKSSMGNPAQAGNGLQEKNEIEVVEKYDIVADRQQRRFPRHLMWSSTA